MSNSDQKMSHAMQASELRSLTKSRFKLALECPTKLFYTRKQTYHDRSKNDDFMRALAEGGHQVGALAQAYYPGGVLVKTLELKNALEATDALLQRHDVIIYEAAFQYGNLLVRTDLLIKKGDEVRLIEVKAKSCTPQTEFLSEDGALISEWSSYLCDVAFQEYVIRNAKPKLKVRPFLMCADKSKMATVDGLNRRFQISRDKENRSHVKIIGDVELGSLGDPLLHEFDVSEVVERIQSGDLFTTPLDDVQLALYKTLPGVIVGGSPRSSFEQTIFYFANCYYNDLRIQPRIDVKCQNCQFHAGVEERAKGLKCGFRECWQQAARFNDNDFERPMVLDIWNWRGRSKRIASGTYFQSELKAESFPKEHRKPDGELTAQGRQWLQIQMSAGLGEGAFLARDWLQAQLANWQYPLHFIDFETSVAAIPFHIGRRPYEQIAFQFSHHRVDADGVISHAGEWILAAPGEFPNFEFIRALKLELSQDNGTIFRYADHENTVLNQIRLQLLESTEPDRVALVKFIESITHPTKSAIEAGHSFTPGRREIVDLRKIVIGGYYHSLLKGSNSIKAVLPAILNSSTYLKQKYAEPIYGDTISSKNFTKLTLVKLDECGQVLSPYLELLPVIRELDSNLVSQELLYSDQETIKEGGAASVAYGRIQYTEMVEAERESVRKALLRYCEIDTMAMVLIWEYLMSELFQPLKANIKN